MAGDDKTPSSSSYRKREKKSDRESSSKHRSEKHKSSKSDRSKSSKDDDLHGSSHRHRRSAKDQESKDIESKRKGREMQGSVRPGGIAVGVVSVGPEDKKAVSQRRKAGDNRRSNRESQDDRDKESQRRAKSSSTSSTRPGAVSSSGSDVSKSKRTGSSSRVSSRESARHGSERESQKIARASTRRATRPGAESSNKEARGKGKMKNVEEEDIDVDNNDDAFEIHAELVDDNSDDDEKINKKATERVRKQMEKEKKRVQQQMQDENDRLRREMEEMQQQAEADKKKKKKRNCIIVFIFLVVAGGGAGGYFGWQGSKGSKESVPADASPTVKETESPTDLVVTSPSPTDTPSSSPTSFFTYPPPSQEDCDAVAQQRPVEGEENMRVMGFAIDLEAILSSDVGLDAVMSDVEAKLQSVLIPSLVGCTDLPRRQLRGEGGGGDVQGHRKLVNNPLQYQYAIANGNVTVQLSGEGVCETGDSQQCYLILAALRLSVRGQERIYEIETLLRQLFERIDLAEFLLLNEPTQILRMAKIISTDKTDPPSASPTGIPSVVPSMAPSSTPSTSAPSSEPSKNPTRAPAAGATNEPTAAPVPDATPSPTVTPLTPAPTCAGVGAYFDSGSFSQQNGSQNGSYNVFCTANTDLVALTYNSDTCTVQCVGFLRSASYSQSCRDSDQVRFELEGNFQNENLLIGYRSSSNTLICGENMIVITDSPTQMPFPGSTPVPTITASAPPTLFPTSAPTNPPTPLPTSAPTATPSLSPTAATPNPTSHPTDVPTHDPTSSPTPVPTSGPTLAPSTPAPSTRREYYENLLSGIPVNTNAMNWLIDNENFYPNPTNPRIVEEVLERHDLIRLYQSTNGGSWTKKDNWLSSQHVCAWQGVTCSGDYYVTELRLYQNNLSGSIPTEIGRLGNLVGLKLNAGNFGSSSQSLPATLSDLTQLTHLDIDNSNLKGTIPELQGLTNLNFLSLRQNKLSGSIPVLPHVFPSNDCSDCLLQRNNFSNRDNAKKKNCKVDNNIGGTVCKNAR